MQKNMISGSIYDAAITPSSTKYLSSRYPRVGTVVEFDDGRKYVFCSTAVDVAAGQLVSHGTALATPVDNICTAAAAGATEVLLDTTSVAIYGGTNAVWAQNALAGGYLVTNDDAGEGYIYRIKAQSASTAAGKTATLTLFDPLVVALTTASDIFIVGPRYMGVVLATTALPPVGIACVATTAGTAVETQYFWVQTAGIASAYVTTGTNVAIGKVAVADTAGVKLGTLSGNAEDMQIPVGIFAGTETTATGKCPVLLTIGG